MEGPCESPRNPMSPRGTLRDPAGPCKTLRDPVSRSQFCSVQPLPRRPQSIGSDWTGAGPKASVLLCTRVIIELDLFVVGVGGGGANSGSSPSHISLTSTQEVELMYRKQKKGEK